MLKTFPKTLRAMSHEEYLAWHMRRTAKRDRAFARAMWAVLFIAMALAVIGSCSAADRYYARQEIDRRV